VTNLAGINFGTVMWGTTMGWRFGYRAHGQLGDSDLSQRWSERFHGHQRRPARVGSGATAQWVDVDNDGDLDLVLSAGGALSARLCRNDGNDQFTSVTNALPQVYDSSHSWADYDNDGDQDVLISGYNFGSGGVYEMTRLYRNDGRGNFTTAA